jgi:hypothetical protein
MSQAHPEADALQRLADGNVDADLDRPWVDHVSGCATCRDEIERIRRVSAAMALSSQPPADLFSQIKGRRAAGERVALPVPRRDVDETTVPDVLGAVVHPQLEDLHRLADGDVDPTAETTLIEHVEQCLACQSEIELARRGASLIALASRVPERPFDQLRQRRSTGERLLTAMPNDQSSPQLATPSAAQRLAGTRPGRRRRAYVWSYAIAASLMLAVGLRVLARSPRSEPVDSGFTFTQGPDSATTGSDSVTRIRTWASLRAGLNRVQVASPAVSVSAGEGAIVIRLAKDAFTDTIPTVATATALREIGTLLAARRGYAITVRASTDSVGSALPAVHRAALVRAVASGLVAGGLEVGRIRVTDAPMRGSLGAAEVEVTPNR